MSDAPVKKRCPHCAWAIKQADRLQLSYGESWVFVVLAEIVDGASLHRHITQSELARATRMTPATVARHVKALVEHGCIRIERTREGYHYHLLRDDPAPVRVRPRMPWDDEPAAVTLQQAQQTPEPVAQRELQNFDIRKLQQPAAETPGPSKIADPDLQNSKVPLMKSPLEETLRKKEPSLRSGRTRDARAPESEDGGSNVIVLATKTESAQAIEAWNTMAARCDLPRVIRPGEAALRRLAAQIRRHGLSEVLRAIGAVGESPWCTGVNDSGWRADFYFVLQAQSFDRLLSGFYAARTGIARVRPGTLAATAQKYKTHSFQPTFDPEPADVERIAQ